MAKRIYVGNLSYRTTEDDLSALFEQAGQVESVNIITDRDTGRSKGFAFVEMGNEAAERAIAQFNGTELNGRALTVNQARPREERSGGRASFAVAYNRRSKQTLEIYTTPDPHAAFIVEERTIDGPKPIERTLYLNSEAIAVAYVDSPETEATLAWPLLPSTKLEDVLDCYLTDFLPRYRPLSSQNTLEFWIGDQYYQTIIGPEPTSRLVIQNLKNTKLDDRGPIRLLQLSSESEAMEILFDESTKKPVRLALVISAVCVKPLARLFSRFHRNNLVRENLDIALRAFAPDPLRSRGFKNLLYSLPIIPEE